MSRSSDRPAFPGALIPRICFLLVLALFCTSSCVSTIYPPDDVKEACTVYLLKESRHRAIVFPAHNGFVEYGFGDWDWYVLMKDRWYHVFDTVLWPTRGCLGRRYTTHLPRRELHPVVVEKKNAEQLLADLNQRFEDRKDTEYFNSVYGIRFVEGDGSFSMFYNCNDACADWMKRLDCRVTWAPILWDIETADSH